MEAKMERPLICIDLIGSTQKCCQGTGEDTAYDSEGTEMLNEDAKDIHLEEGNRRSAASGVVGFFWSYRHAPP